MTDEKKTISEEIEETPPSAPEPKAVEPKGLWLDRRPEWQITTAVILFGLCLYVPLAGTYGLWDPWETHYGEVARQMVARGDYVSLWWPGSPIDREYFWSKPVLTFWVMALSMGLAGITGSTPSGTLATTNIGEWALRLPFALLALTAIYGVYLVLSRFVSRRAGLFGAVIIATMPMFSLIARQAMTDMPFVGPMTLALALAALALFSDNAQELPRKGWKRFTWPHHASFYTAFILVLLAAVPTLIIECVQLVWRFRLGGKTLVAPGVVALLPWILGVVAFVYWSAKVRFKAPSYLIAAGGLAGLAVLAKGIAGLGLPVIILVAYISFTGEWKRFTRPQMVYGVLIAVLAFFIVAGPWHHAMLVRHGGGFWSELYGDNHWKRLVTGRHGDRGAFDYFLREGAYAIWPWLALAPAALASAATRSIRGADNKVRIFWFGAIWFVAAYAVVSSSMTKFHHYILPSLPGLAIAIACFLDELVDRARSSNTWGRLVAVAGTPLIALVAFDLARTPKAAERFIWLFAYDYVNNPKGRDWPSELDFSAIVVGFAIAFSVATALMAWRRLRPFGVWGLCLAAVAFTFFLLDGYMPKVTGFWSQKALVASYYQKRASPEEPLVAWQMYWRGENFYTQNEIYEGPRTERTVFLGNNNAKDLQAYLGRNPGKLMFFLVEKTRFEKLRSLLPASAQNSLEVVDKSNNKFYLAKAQL